MTFLFPTNKSFPVRILYIVIQCFACVHFKIHIFYVYTSLALIFAPVFSEIQNAFLEKKIIIIFCWIVKIIM